MTHIVMIDCHDLGRHLSCYGRADVPSPALDALAEDGVRFENGFCTSPQCSPSRAALYTGYYPHHNGMMGLAHAPFNWSLNDDQTHLAAYLQNAGYHTALAGSQHVTHANEGDIKRLGFDDVLPAHLAPDVAEQAVGFLERDHTRPFFLNVGLFEPHRDDAGGFKLFPPENAPSTLPPYIPDTPEARQEFGELHGMIRAMDDGVGRIVATLKRRGLLDDTWLIFTTDHGLAMPRAKCTLYDPGLETALIMFAPSLGLNGGRVITEPVSHVDLVPTILEWLGLDAPDDIHGRSYWPLLTGGQYQQREAIFAEKTFHTAYEPQRAIRTERYKLIWNAEVDVTNVPADIRHSAIYPQMIDLLTIERPPFELYDLRDDPHEMNNVAGNPTYHDIERDLRERLLDWMRQTDDPLLRGPVASPYYHDALAQLTGNEPS